LLTDLLLPFVPLEIAHGLADWALSQQVDMLSEINIAPRILTNFTGVMPPQFKKDLDSYLKTRSPVTFLSDLRSNLQVSGWFPRMLKLRSVGQMISLAEAASCLEGIVVVCSKDLFQAVEKPLKMHISLNVSSATPSQDV